MFEIAVGHDVRAALYFERGIHSARSLARHSARGQHPLAVRVFGLDEHVVERRMGAVVSVRDQRDPAAKHEQILPRTCAVVAHAIAPHLAAYPRRNGHVESARTRLVMCAVRRENGFCAAVFAQRRICRRDDVFAVDKDAERALVALGTAVKDIYPRFAKLREAAAALVEHYAVFTAARRPRGRHFGRRALEPVVRRPAAGDKALPHPRDRFAVALGRGHQHPDRRKARR